MQKVISGFGNSNQKLLYITIYFFLVHFALKGGHDNALQWQPSAFAETRLLQILLHLYVKGAFNNYVDRILPNFDNLPPPWVDNSRHFI